LFFFFGGEISRFEIRDTQHQLLHPPLHTTMRTTRTDTAATAVATMKAAVYHEFGGPITVQDVAIPLIPSATGILLQVHAVGVCRSDWHGWKGHDGDVIEHGLPFTPGHEIAGIVVSVGADVKTLVPGDRVAVPFILSCGSCRYYIPTTPDPQVPPAVHCPMRRHEDF
jgi:hypothetical protein